MAKKYNKMTKAGLAALLVTSAIVPVASANAQENVDKDIDQVVIKLADGTLAKIGLDQYGTYLSIGLIKDTNITHVIDKAGNIYTLPEYGAYLSVYGNVEDAISGLENDNKAVEVTVVQGNINENGNVVVDQTPEENLNETFFYNLAA